MSIAKLQGDMGSHLLPIERGRHLRLPCRTSRRVCRLRQLRHNGALGGDRHSLLGCPALADLREELSRLVSVPMYIC